MGTIRERTTKSGETRYLAIVRMKGQPPQTKTHRNRTAAKKWITRVEAALVEGRDLPNRGGKRTMAAVFDRYETAVLPQKAKSTQVTQEAQLTWWRDRVGHLRVADLTPSVVLEARDALSAAPSRRTVKKQRKGEPEPEVKRLAPATVNRFLALLSHVMTQARKWGWAGDNPVKDVDRLTESKSPGRALSRDELRQLMGACEEAAAVWLKPFVVVALATSARRGALLKLCWRDVDLERGVVTLYHTKTGRGRSVTLGAALPVLKDWAAVRFIGDDRVFPHASNVSHVFARAAKRAGLDGFRLHDLRHTALTRMAQMGATTAQVQAVSGHETVSMVARYTHLHAIDAGAAAVVAAMTEEMFGETHTEAAS